MQLLGFVRSGGRVVAHNAGFERRIWNFTVRRRPEYAHWPEMTIAQQDCTMSRALALHLPAELGELSKALGLGEGKSESGRALMLKMAKPRKRLPDGTYVWWDDPAMLDELGRTRCDQDVLDESAIDAKLPLLSSAERRLWELDQHINDRGIAIDLPMVERAIAVLAVAQQRANARMAELTGGAVRKCSEAAKIVAWLQTRGMPCESIAKAEHAGLNDWADLLGDATAREVVELRAEAAKNSTAKYRRMQEVVCDDGRARGLFSYHRAGTGRWGGALVQTQNMPRVDPDKEMPDVLAALEVMEMFCA